MSYSQHGRHTLLYVTLACALLGTVRCGDGEGDSSPIGPSSVTPTPQAGQSSADPNEVARQIALVTMEGLQVGGVSTSESVAPTIRTLHAGGSYHVQCNKGGEVDVSRVS